jgi:reactive intermediate/imine deaminase
MKQVIQTTHAPAALGPYSQAILAGNTLYCSGQIGLDPATGNLADGVQAQAEQAFTNLLAVAKAAGFAPADAVKCTLFLTNLGDFATVNGIMQAHFQTPYPARSTVEVSALPKAAQFEIEAIFVK